MHICTFFVHKAQKNDLSTCLSFPAVQKINPLYASTTPQLDILLHQERFHNLMPKGALAAPRMLPAVAAVTGVIVLGMAGGTLNFYV